MIPFKNVEEICMEFDAGIFVVEEGEDNIGFIKFYIREWEGGYWKGGFVLVGFKIHPTCLVNDRTYDNQ